MVSINGFQKAAQELASFASNFAKGASAKLKELASSTKKTVLPYLDRCGFNYNFVQNPAFITKGGTIANSGFISLSGRFTEISKTVAGKECGSEKTFYRRAVDNSWGSQKSVLTDYKNYMGYELDTLAGKTFTHLKDDS